MLDNEKWYINLPTDLVVKISWAQMVDDVWVYEVITPDHERIFQCTAKELECVG